MAVAMQVKLEKLRHETAMKIVALSDRSEVSLSSVERILRDHDATVQAWQDAPNRPDDSEQLDEFALWLNCGRVKEVNQKGNYLIPSIVPEWAGCYRLVLDDGSEYIGEGFSLRRRISEYCDKGTSARDFKMRDRIKASGGMQIFVRVQTNARKSDYALTGTTLSKQHETAFPGARAARVRFEKQLEAEAKARGAVTLNSSGERRR